MTTPSQKRRLIDWTGERFVPWAPDVQVAYEHLHRYFWAAELARGRRVLDLGSGEGYGAAILASAAESVVGIDIDEATVQHSRLNYDAPNLQFSVGSALDLREFDPESFGVIVAFEVIEHLGEQGRMLDEIKRVLAPDGLVVISTPDKRKYSYGGPEDENPYHVRELTGTEFESLLASRFEHLRVWGQRTIAGSRITNLRPADGNGASSFFVEHSDDEWHRQDEPDAIYLLAVASERELDGLPPDSTLLDPGLELVRVHEREISAIQEHHAVAIAAMREQGEVASSEARAAARELAALRGEVRTLRRITESARRELMRPSWQLFQGIRNRLFRAVGERSWLGSALRSMLVVALNALRGRRWSEGLRNRIELPASDAPVASLIIPVHAHPGLTEACLRSIAGANGVVPYEVIIVNDTADPPTSRLLRSARGARLIVNETNLGFTRSINRGAAAAKGRYLVLFNNDVQVHPGWLEALVECADSADDIGVVTPRFVYPDGRINEAGGMVWNDATGAHAGCGEQPDNAVYNHRREVDYGSAAALLVRSDLWQLLGGFDERFAPGYYEDTDLCFAARERGYRVMYEPAAEVMHIEGATQGTDIASGGKRYQEINRSKFAAKWARQLEEQPPPPQTADDLRRAQQRGRRDHVVVIDHRLPSPDLDSGSVRMMHMLRALLALGNSVTFIPENLWAWEPYCRRLQSMGIQVLYDPIDVRSELAEMSDGLRLAILSRPTTALRYLHWIREFAPDAKVVYDTVDLHFVRELRRAKVEQQSRPLVAHALREMELALIRATDVTLCVSETERQSVLGEVPDATVEIVSNAHDPARDVPPADQRAGLLFLGGFEHLPNIDAAHYLVETVMPLVWSEVATAHLNIVGSHTPDDVRELESERVTVTGWVEEIEPVLDSARAMVAPLRYGAGVKGKITQSLARGLPVVTTELGAEGIQVTDGREMLIADEPASFADRVAQVCTDDELWRRLSVEGLRHAKRVFSVEAVTETLRSLLDGSTGITGDEPTGLARLRRAATRAEDSMPQTLTTEGSPGGRVDAMGS